MSDVLQKLKTSTGRIKATLRPQVGRFISAGHAAGHEIYFLIDLSQSVNQQALNNSLTFCLKLIERVRFLIDMQRCSYKEFDKRSKALLKYSFETEKTRKHTFVLRSCFTSITTIYLKLSS